VWRSPAVWRSSAQSLARVASAVRLVKERVLRSGRVNHQPFRAEALYRDRPMRQITSTLLGGAQLYLDRVDGLMNLLFVRSVRQTSTRSALYRLNT
jgi:hypothetical protein